MPSNVMLKKQIAALEERRRREEENRMLKRKLRRLRNPGLARVADNTGAIGRKLAKRLSENSARIRKKGLGL